MPDDTHWYPGSDPELEEQAAELPVTGDQAAGTEDGPDSVQGRVGCRTDLRGWAGAHLHGAVRPRRRTAGRGRPPGRWC